ncbi:siderophore-interacting protein [Brevibacterium album]|uniref:siderophore-interacting protein n=1 Tax=Brevibacterium album TaxID=417948 RepID=UPI00048E1655|nr:siderophore-interacting protein [Brevibacterium album]
MPPRSAYRPFSVTVSARRQLSASFHRLTFSGPDLHRFADTCLDQRIKLVLGPPEVLAQAAAADSWLDWWRAQPDETRPIMRTYTSRRVRREDREVDVDFVAHGTEGPASRFALTARVGEAALLVGADAEHPEADVQGVTWRTDGAAQVLLAGDETAQPAIANILRSLPAHVTGAAFVEVPSPADALATESPSRVTVSYLPRTEGSARGELLAEAVFGWADAWAQGAGAAASGAGHPAHHPSPSPAAAEEETTTEAGLLWEEGTDSSGLRIWAAADALTVRTLRRGLVRERGFDRKSCSFMGYWKPGSREGE